MLSLCKRTGTLRSILNNGFRQTYSVSIQSLAGTEVESGKVNKLLLLLAPFMSRSSIALLLAHEQTIRRSEASATKLQTPCGDQNSYLR
jgi:hypothetical protein